MRYLHTMIRVLDLKETLRFFQEGLGLIETRRRESERGRFTLVFLAEAEGAPELELTWNWDETEVYSGGRNFGHVAYEVDNVYDACSRLQSLGVTILRPPRDGRMAFIRSPDGISVELLQRDRALPIEEPWASMTNQGDW